MEEVDFDDEVLLIHPDEDIRKIEAEADTNSNLDQASSSDSGEINDDEEANDLEEGEIQESSPVSKKKSDIACRFFKRGSCAYGSQCQYLHVSDTVYKMFDTNPQKRNDIPLVEHHSFPKPPIFPPNVLPPRPFIEPPIKVIVKSDFPRPYEPVEDNWEKGLEQARILIRKANLKKKSEDSEPKKFNSKNNKDEKDKGQFFTKSNLGNEVDFTNKKYFEKNSTNNSFRKGNAYDDKKSNYRYQSRPSDKWVDPWRRSKSPLSKKRQRSLSGSPPSRSRKHSSTSSTSSLSSTSSEVNDIYRRPYEKKSPRGQLRLKSRSRSLSQSRWSKKRRISPKYFNGRRVSRSISRSLSRSPYRKRSFSSRTQSRSSSSSSSCSDCQKTPNPEETMMKRISAKLDEQMSKSPKRALELLDSDCETSEMTVSSASCTPLSSDTEADSPYQSPSLRRKKSPTQNNANSYLNKTSGLAKPKPFNRNPSNLLKTQDLLQYRDPVVPPYQKKTQPSNNGKNQNNWSFKTELVEPNPKNTTSSVGSVKKPAPAPKFPEKKISNDMQLLFMYQGLGKNNSNVQKAKSNDLTSKSNRTEDAVNVANKANSSNLEPCNNAFKADKGPKKNIVLKLKPKDKDGFKPDVLNKYRDMDEMVTVKKETASKREQLLNKLKLIDDAIARKKYK